MTVHRLVSTYKLTNRVLNILDYLFKIEIDFNFNLFFITSCHINETLFIIPIYFISFLVPQTEQGAIM